MSVYRRGKFWNYEFSFRGIRIRESTHSPIKDVAIRAERERRRQLELGSNHLKAVQRPPTLSVALEKFLQGNLHWTDSTRRAYGYHAAHLLPRFGKLLLSEVVGAHISAHQAARVKAGASPRTINQEVALLRQLLREHRFWPVEGKVRPLRAGEDVGRALSADEIMRIEAAARGLRSRSLPVALTLYRFTGMRSSELRTMKWAQADLIEGHLTVGKAKTRASEGRRIELAPTALAALKEWRARFPDAKPEHYIFPSEMYGVDGLVHSIKPDKPIGTWKQAWTSCRKAAGVQCRLHDLRHFFVSRLAENPEVSDATIMSLTGHVSRKMLNHYSHVRAGARRRAVLSLEDSPQITPQAVSGDSKDQSQSSQIM